jgi:hypothetical protein
VTVLFGIVLTWASVHLQYRIYATNRPPKRPGVHRTEGLFVSP